MAIKFWSEILCYQVKISQGKIPIVQFCNDMTMPCTCIGITLSSGQPLPVWQQQTRVVPGGRQTWRWSWWCWPGCRLRGGSVGWLQTSSYITWKNTGDHRRQFSKSVSMLLIRDIYKSCMILKIMLVCLKFKVTYFYF